MIGCAAVLENKQLLIQKVAELPMRQDDIQSKVLEILREATRTAISIDEPLLTSGLIDSIAAVDIALAVEGALGVAIPATEIGLRLQTARTLIDYVSSHR